MRIFAFFTLISALVLVSAHPLSASPQPVILEGSYSTVQSPSVIAVDSDSSHVALELRLNGFETTSIFEGNSTFQKITLPGVHEYLSEEGKPRLPVVRRLIAVPDSVTLHIALSDTSLYTLTDYPVYPVPCVSYPDTGCLCFIESFCSDTDFYETETLYPATAFEVSQTGYMREQKIIELRIFPIRCDPSSEKLFVNTFSHINISYEGTPYFNTKGLGPFEEIAGLGSVCYEPWESPPPAPPDSSGGADAGQILNLGGGQDGGVQPGPVKCLKYLEELKVEGTLADYIVIAAPAYYNELYYPPRESYMDSLLLWRKNFNELCVAVASTQQINEEFDYSTPSEMYWEKVYAFLEYAYEHYEAPNMADDKIGYVLILGDDCMKESLEVWDYCDDYQLAQFVPTGFSVDYSFPTDHFYMTLHGNDNVPDIMLGRLPISNIAQMNIVAEKLFRYEKYLPEYRGVWRREGSFINGTGQTGEGHCDNFESAFFDPIDYDLFCLDYEENSELTESDFYNEMNDGRLLVYINAHGHQESITLNGDTFEYICNDEIDANLDPLGTFVSFPVIFAHSCNTGQFYYFNEFSYSEAVSEVFLEVYQKGALGYFGFISPTGIAGQSLTKGVEAILLNNITELGKALMSIKFSHINYWKNLTLLGDPISDVGEHIAYPDMPDPSIIPSQLSLPWRGSLGDSLPLSAEVLNRGGATADGFILSVVVDADNITPVSWEFPIDDLESREGVRFDFKWDVTELTTHIENASLEASISYGDTSVSIEDVESWTGNDDAEVSISEIQLQPDREGWPVKLNGSLTSSPVLFDLDGNDTLEVILGASDGRLHVFRENGEYLPGWPVEFATVEEWGVINTSPAVGDIDGDSSPDVICIVNWSGSQTNELYAFQYDGLPAAGNWPVPLNLVEKDASPMLGNFAPDSAGLEILIVDDRIRTFSGHGYQIWSYDFGFPDWRLPCSPAYGPLTDADSLEVVFHPYTRGTMPSIRFVRLRAENGTEKFLFESSDYEISSQSVALVNWGNQDTLEVIVPYWSDSNNHNLTSVDSNYDENPDWIGKECGSSPCTPALGKVETSQTTDVALGADWSNVSGHEGLEINLFDYRGNLTFFYPGIEREVGSIIGSSVIGDVDADGQQDVLTVTNNGFVYTLNGFGESLTNFHWPFNVHAVASVGAPAVGDLDGDDYADIIVCGGDNYLFVWDMNPGGAPPDSLSTPEWPMFRRNSEHTGCYDE